MFKFFRFASLPVRNTFVSTQFFSFSLKNIDFQNFYPIIKDLKNSETFEFKMLLENIEGNRLLFDLSKTHTIQDLFNKILENLQFKSLKAYSLDKVELSNMTPISNLERSNFYILADDHHLFKIIDTNNESLKFPNEIEKYCEDLNISHLQKKIISNYLSRVDILNEMKFGFKVFEKDNDNNNKMIEKEELLVNLIEALPTNRINLIYDENALQKKYFKLKSEVDNLQSQKKQLERYAHKMAKRKMILGLFALFGQFGFVGYGTYVVYSWDIIEPMVYFIGLGTSILLGLQYFKINEQFSNTSFYEYLKKKDLAKLCNKVSFDLKTLEDKEHELENLEKIIKSNFLMNL